MEKRNITVNGMRCENCEAKVMAALKKMDGVSEAKADRTACCVEVEYDPAAVSLEDMCETVEDCGFEAKL